MGDDWLEILRRKQQRVHVLREELAQLEAELREGRAILAGRVDVSQSAERPKSRHGFTGGKRTKPIQQGSSVWWTKRVLEEAGEPLHIDKILQYIQQERGQQIQKNTLVSNLSRYVKHGDTFTRPGPSIFGLTAWAKRYDENLMPGK